MAIITVNNSTATITAKEVMPNTNIDAPRPLASSAFKKLHTNILAIVDNATQIAAITKDSEKNILNTSALLAPTAHKIPISFFF